MKVIRQNKELIISIPENELSLTELQDMLDYFKLRAITSKSKATEKDVALLSEEVDKNWWKKNKPKFLK